MRKGFIINMEPLAGLSVGTSRLVATKFVGGYKSVFKGRGLEFGGYRKYISGDDASLIDWKVSARAGEILVKELIEERNVNVFFLVDVSNSMLYSSHDKLKSEFAAELIGSLSFVILHTGDSVGLSLFSNKVVRNISPLSGVGRHYQVMKELSEVKNYGGDYNLVEALKYVGSFLERQSVLVIISDFIGLRGDWGKHLKLASMKYDIIGIMVRDPRDKRLPEMEFGNVLLEGPYDEGELVVNIKDVAPKYKQYVSRQENKLRETFLKTNSDFLSLETDSGFVSPLMQFFRERANRRRA
tara:strand:- start:44 stop:937 length:894 start_codon:yes stop_codon:yes gene_type:complete